MRKGRLSLFAVTAALVASVLSPAKAAVANTSTCPHFHDPSTACDYNLAAQYGVEDTFQYTTMTLSASDIAAGNHINNTLWGYGTGCGISMTENDELEVGYTLGFEGTGGYHIYWAVVGGGVYYEGDYADVTNDNTYHKFDVFLEADAGSTQLDGRTVVSAQKWPRSVHLPRSSRPRSRTRYL
jgi:hypothetical protein